MSHSPKADWFSDWFNSDYLRLYPHRDEAAAIREVEFVASRVKKSVGNEIKGSQTLDIGCGAGRHLLPLARGGFNPTGVDLSPELLEEARIALATAGIEVPLVRADMRTLPFEDKRFNLITNFFTSFGYFESDDEHLRLLREWRRVLKDDGNLFLDYLNRDFVIKNLVPETIETRGASTVRQTRSVSDDGLRINKSIEISENTSGAATTKTFKESVRMYSQAELVSLLTASGFTDLQWYGDFSGAPLTTESPRSLCLATASSQTPSLKQTLPIVKIPCGGS